MPTDEEEDLPININCLNQGKEISSCQDKSINMISYGDIENISWTQAQKDDENLKIVREWITSGVFPTKEEQKAFNLELRRYAQIQDKLNLHESGTLYIQKYENESDELEEKRPLLPDSKVKDVYIPSTIQVRVVIGDTIPP